MNFIRQAFSRVPPQVLLLLVAVIAYWQIAFLHNSLKWDAIDVVFPWRYYVSEALQNNYLPLWNPYQQMGYPLYADMQYPFWYIEQLIIGYTIGYNNYTLHFLFILYIWLGGCGMYRLTSFLKTGKHEAFYAGVIYMLSGFMVAHIQSFILIISTAWIPHVIVQYLKMIKSNSYRHLPATALFIFLLVTGAYPAFTIITGYLLFFLFANQLFNYIRTKDFRSLYTSLKINGTLAITVLLFSTFIFVLLYQLAPYTNRISGIPLEFANFNPLSPQCLVSLLTPFATVKENAFFGTDISMANTYIGLSTLVFIIASLFRKKNGEEKIFISFGTIALLAALGEYTPIRGVLFKYLPGLNLFRFPSIISYFTLLTFIPIAAKQFQYLKSTENKSKPTFYFSGLIVLLLVSIFIFSLNKFSFENFSFKNIVSDFYTTLETSTIYEHLFSQSLLQVIIFSSLTIALWKKKYNLFLLLVFVEMFAAVQLNIHYTGLTYIKPNEIKAATQNLPKGFPLPAMRPIERNSDIAASVSGLNRNTNIFRKQISYDGYTSFWLKQYDSLFADNLCLKNAVLKNPYFYLSSNVQPLSKIPQDSICNFPTDMLFVNDSIYSTLIINKLHVEAKDSLTPLTFTPSDISLHTKTSAPSILTLLQSNYYGWTVFIDGKPAEHFTSNLLFISVLLPAGTHEVTYVYSNRPFVYSLILSYTLAILLLLWLIVRYRNANRAIGKYLLFGLIAVITVVALLLFFRYGKNPQAKNEQVLKEMISEISNGIKTLNSNNITSVINCDNHELVSKYSKSVALPFAFTHNHFGDNYDKAQLINTVDTSKTDYFLLAWSNNTLATDVKYIVKQKFPYEEATWTKNNYGYILFSKKGANDIAFEAFNNFEQADSNTADPRFADTTIFYSSNKACLLDSINSYSPAFGYMLTDISKQQENNIYIACRFYMPQTTNAILVISIENKNKVKEWMAIPLKDYITNAKGWNKIVFSKQLAWISPDDRISAYVWNNDKNPMYVDDLEMKIYNSLK